VADDTAPHQKAKRKKPVLKMTKRVPRFMRGIFVGYLLGLPVLIYLSWPNFWWIWVWCTVAWAMMIYASLRANCQWFGPVVTRFNTGSKEVWLTIDDGPHPEDTPRILDLLDKYHAKAAFFVIGTHAEEHPELIASIVRRGHRLGNHSYKHRVASFWCLPKQSVSREIDNCSKVLEKLTGQRCEWFRAPVGMANWHVHAALRARSMRLIGWSARGLDGLPRDPELIARRLLAEVKPGSIILLHEGQRDVNGNPINIINLGIILERLQQQGYSFVLPEEKRWESSDSQRSHRKRPETLTRG
jgi:peptidoglycan/xylan/chitin deacetylase (PgdA/CDA1 family)